MRRLSGGSSSTRHFCCTLVIEVLYSDALNVHFHLFESFFIVLCNALLISKRELARGQRRFIFPILFVDKASHIAVMTDGSKELLGYYDEVFDAFWKRGWRLRQKKQFQDVVLSFLASIIPQENQKKYTKRIDHVQEVTHWKKK